VSISKHRSRQRPITSLELDDALEAIATDARRLRPPLNEKPEAFHEDKSELVDKIAKLRDQVRSGVRVG
jgi:hypothetical protein